MKNILFYKMVASGNDFIVLDNRPGRLKDPVRFTREICSRHRGVGADGVLLFGKSKKAAFKITIINSDGSRAEACGNGFRCMAKYAREVIGLPSQFEFESISGIISAKVGPNGVRVRMPDPKDLRQDRAIDVSGNRLHYSFLNTGVPHVVVFAQGLDAIDVETIGRSVRRHDAFKPKGTNVNFVEIRDEKSIRVRTYERGVEAETLACGTGSTASAILSALAGYVRPPVRVHTRGGEVLTIDFVSRGTDVRGVSLEGRADFICEGKYYLSPRKS